MKILITGGDGDIAQAIKKELENIGHTVYAPNHKEMDVTSGPSVALTIAEFEPDVIINNAGLIKTERIDGDNIYAISSWRDQIDVNLIGPYICARAGIQRGVTQIINIGSSAGAKGKAEWSAYCAAKAGVERLTESLHAEGHCATCLRIGRTATKMRSSLVSGEEDPDTLLTPSEIATIVTTIIEKPHTFSGAIVPIYKSDGIVFVGGF
jgi:3-oxoacyl-[acyl-carrier protein] reductase